jgi:hypothetical protein
MTNHVPNLIPKNTVDNGSCEVNFAVSSTSLNNGGYGEEGQLGFGGELEEVLV